jgi:demethylmenaquinone methyltransferase/2-methoxy-6-polyprenyl-1,4-benzoquinol methylase
MMMPSAFARDAATAMYYDRRAGEYDDWYEGRGRFAGRDRPGWVEEVETLIEFMRGLPACPTLDVACGTGYLTRHLRGFVVGLDQSQSMVALARQRIVSGAALVADALALPFADNAFDRVLTAHFYGHLPANERDAFLVEAQRVSAELIVIDSAIRPGIEGEQWQERILNDGSRHRVYKRFLDAEQLASEIGGQVAVNGSWFVAARART